MPESVPLIVEYRPLDALIPYARNARTHSDAQVAQIAASLREFGWTNPILIDDDGNVIAGHGRLLAARKLDYAVAPTICLSHLTPAQRRAYVIADNKLAELAGWDCDLLALELGELNALSFDVSKLGFAPEEVADLLVGPSFGPASADSQGKLDEKAPIVCPNCGHEFTR
ncbi:ParB/Srx family N-terminal domain-containing protein [Burkholderia stagnalis]|uniref:ParB/Srx family N-terminal domain-containing protein n=1 Tax=Burkholderia stagnalis TaxID=1503054 RepID=UPI000F811BF9|nr:ParB/Srx family N-terminal domain-containing protein [Burkholderia stagnalis]